MHLIEINQLSFSYSQLEALKNVTLHADSGGSALPRGSQRLWQDHAVGSLDRRPSHPKTEALLSGKSIREFSHTGFGQTYWLCAPVQTRHLSLSRSGFRINGKNPPTPVPFQGQGRKTGKSLCKPWSKSGLCIFRTASSPN